MDTKILVIGAIAVIAIAGIYFYSNPTPGVSGTHEGILTQVYASDTADWDNPNEFTVVLGGNPYILYCCGAVGVPNTLAETITEISAFIGQDVKITSMAYGLYNGIELR